MQDQNYEKTTALAGNDGNNAGVEPSAAKESAEETSRLFSRSEEQKGFTGAYERYHTNHGGALLSEEKKQEIRERVARTLAEGMGVPLNFTQQNLSVAEAKEPEQQSSAEADMVSAQPEQTEEPNILPEESAKPDKTKQNAAEQSEDEQPTRELDKKPSDATKAQAAPGKEQSDKRGILTGEGTEDPFSYTDFRLKRANAVKEFFNNMRDFTFTKTNQEAVEMLHMRQQKPPAKNEEPQQTQMPQADNTAAERKENLRHIIGSEKRMSLLRAIVTVVLFGISLVFLTVNPFAGGVSLLGIQLSGRIVAAMELLTLLLGGVVSFNVYIGAYRLINNHRFGKEILAAVIYTAGLIYTLFCLIVPSAMLKEYYTSYTPWYLLTMCAYHLGMHLQMRRLERQFVLTTAKNSPIKYSLEPLENRFLLQNLDAQRRENSLVVKQVEADMLSGFEDHGFSPDWFDALVKPFVIALSALAAVAAVGAWVMSGDWMKAVFVFTGTYAFCSPFAAMFAAELPMGRACREQQELAENIHQRYTVLHADAVDEMADAGAIILGSDALFPPESVILHGLRSAAGVRVDEAILDAVSILTAGNSILAPTFLQMISDKKELLKPVDSITYEDGMGISAWVDNNRVLIGSRKMMENHNIRMPSEEIEHLESDKGRMILYLARQGELITAFSLTLKVLPQVSRLLGQARSQGMRLYIKSVDCLVENHLAMLFGEDADIIGILPSRLHADYDKETHSQDAALSLILSDGSAFSALDAVMQLQRLRASLEISRLLVVILLAVTGIFFAAAAMAGNPVLISSAAALIPALLHAAFFLPRR